MIQLVLKLLTISCIGTITTHSFTIPKISFDHHFRHHHHHRRTAAETTTTTTAAPFLSSSTSLKSSSSSSSSEPSSRRPLLIGLNKYTHDTSLCAADATTGEILYNLELERLTRRKHDAGSTSLLLRHCLDSLNAEVEDVVMTVSQNHHHRVLPLEDDATNVEWEEGLGVNEADASEENLLSGVSCRWEVSHHLAHAYSVASQAPFREGLVVVMDGMGETYGTMKQGMGEDGERYHCDLEYDGEFESVPKDIGERAKESVYDWREAESVYVFDKGEDGSRLTVKPVFKRWIEERTPPALYNHGFSNMKSMGAVYSRVSSHIFGDWNTCGKVMGMAPWGGYSWPDITDETHKVKVPLMEGSLYKEEGEGGLHIHWENLKGKPLCAEKIYDPETGVPLKKYDFDEETPPNDIALRAISLSSSIQADLETVALDFIDYLKTKTSAKNLCLVGGVAQNSVLNGRIARESGFDEVFIPPYPGDEGIAVGCCAYGLFGPHRHSSSSPTLPPPHPPLWTQPLSPYLGPSYSSPFPPGDTTPLPLLLSQYAPWLDVDTIPDTATRHATLARELASGTVVAIYSTARGSESGPRALGRRSILADPRKKAAVGYVNKIKKREKFRPFAPSVMADRVHEWFEGFAEDGSGTQSPYMSLTAMVRPEKRSEIPAVTHVDGSARLQTVDPKGDTEEYYRLIAAFFELTGIPMLLNTSFNTLPGEPIVESPRDALRSFLYTMNAIEILVIDDVVIKRKEADMGRLLGEKKKEKGGLITPPAYPQRAGPVQFRSECTLNEDTNANNDDTDDSSLGDVTTRVRMPARIMHSDSLEGGWFELLDEFEGEILGCCDGSTAVEDMIQEWDGLLEKDGKFDNNAFENLIRRLVRLFEFTFISW